MESFNKILSLRGNRQCSLSYDISYMQQCSKIFGIDENYHSYVFLKNKITQVVVSV